MGSMFESSSSSSSSHGSNAWTPELEDLYNNVIGDVINNGVPSGPGHVGLTPEQQEAIAGMGSGGTAGQHYLDILSGKGQAERAENLQALNAATASQLENTLAATGMDFGMNAGQGNSSRRGVAEGVATATANTQMAANNQNWLAQEQALMNQAAAGMQDIYKDQFTGGSIMQQDQMNQALAEWKEKYGQTSVGKLELLLGLGNQAGGIAGGWGNATNTSNPSMFDSMVSAGAAIGGVVMSDRRLKNKIKRTNKKVACGAYIYTWEWSKKAGEIFGLYGADYGVIAQEVAELIPNAVTMTPQGYYAVDYSRLMEVK